MQASLVIGSGRRRGGSVLVPVGILGLGAVLSWLCRVHPTMLPPWAPWEFSWVEYLATACALWFYARGLARTPPAVAPSRRRQVCFVLGMGLIYAVLQTRFEYLSQHMFFVNRVQHLVMHHLGPFLIALAWPGETIARGLPAPLRRTIGHRAVRWTIDRLQQPILAGILFVGLLFLWLIPAVQFRAMIDPRLYAVMNWSMVLDGILFWCLVLDPRPPPAGRLSFGMRVVLVWAVQLPQIVVGAVISFTGHDLYPYYDLCGRVFSSIDAILDQQIGGFVVLYPGGMMSAIAVLILVRAIRMDEERSAPPLRSARSVPPSRLEAGSPGVG